MSDEVNEAPESLSVLYPFLSVFVKESANAWAIHHSIGRDIMWMFSQTLS